MYTLPIITPIFHGTAKSPNPALKVLDVVEAETKKKIGSRRFALEGAFRWSRPMMEQFVESWCNQFHALIDSEEKRRAKLSRPGPRRMLAENLERDLKAYLVSISNAPFFEPTVTARSRTEVGPAGEVSLAPETAVGTRDYFEGRNQIGDGPRFADVDRALIAKAAPPVLGDFSADV